MAVYLVDYENVNSDLLADATVLRPEDCILIFYSRQVNNISLDVLGTLQKGGIKIYYIKTFVGTSNALDFQLVTFLGYLIRGDKNQKYFIVSKDHGFRCIGDFWNSYGVSVQVTEQIGSVGEGTETVAQTGTKGSAASKRAAAGKRTSGVGDAAGAKGNRAGNAPVNQTAREKAKKKSLLPLFKSVTRGTETKEAEKQKHEKAKTGKETGQQTAKQSVKQAEKQTAGQKKQQTAMQAEPTEKELLADILRGFITDPAKREETAAAIAAMETRTQINDYLTKKFRGKQLQGINKAIRPLIRQRPGE